MTTVLEHVGSFADAGETLGQRRAYYDALVGLSGNTAVGAVYYDQASHHQEDATDRDQFPQTD